jgi:hypothetical protein
MADLRPGHAQAISFPGESLKLSCRQSLILIDAMRLAADAALGQGQESDRFGGDAGSREGLGSLSRELDWDRSIFSKVQSETW